MGRNTYQIVGTIAFGFVILFYGYDYLYLNLSPFTRYCIGVLFIFTAVVSTIIIKANLGESSRVMTAKNWGEVTSHDDVHLCFERNKISFIWEPIYAGHKVSFYLPQNEQIFSIRQRNWSEKAKPKSVLEQMLVNENSDNSGEQIFRNCQIISVEGISNEFVLLTNQPEFLRQLLNNEKVKKNLNKYEDKSIRITFNGTLFEMKWIADSNEETEDFQEICQTSIIFQEAMIKLL